MTLEASVISIVKTIDKNAYSTMVGNTLTVNGQATSLVKARHTLMKIYNKLREEGYHINYHGVNIDRPDFTYYLSNIKEE